jgi:hypothetical protein
MSLLWTIAVLLLLLILVLWLAAVTVLVMSLHHELRFLCQILRVSPPPPPEAYPLERDT